MKLLYFRLKGYINILQGMGLDEIVIPFDKLNSRIILIQGENGTGKSTLLNAMIPAPDSSDSFRTDIKIDENGTEHIIEYPAEKELHYQDNEGSIYKILIKSVVNDAMTSRTTKAYISKDGVEYNPNGNVSSFKDFRDELFDINPTYLDMSSIGSENRGLVDMIPSERRKYLSSFIGSVETFNNIFKSLTKTVSSIKTEIGNLNGRIYAIGDSVALESTLDKKSLELASYKKDRDEMIVDKTALEVEMSVLDPYRKIQETYENIAKELHVLKAEVSRNENTIKDTMVLIGGADPYEELKNVTKHLEELNKTCMEHSNKLSSLSMYMESIKSDILNKQSELGKLTSDNYNDAIGARMSELEKDIAFYDNKIGKDLIEKLSKFSKEDITNLHQNILKFVDMLNIVKDSDASALELATRCIIEDKRIDSEILRIRENISTSISMIAEKKTALARVEDDIKSMELLEQRPKTCKDNSCAFVSSLVEISESYKAKDSNPWKEAQAISSIIADLEAMLDQARSDADSYEKSVAIYHSIDDALSLIKESTATIKKFKYLSWMLDKKDLLTKTILNHYPLSEEINYLENMKTIIAEMDNYTMLMNEYNSLKSKYEDTVKSRSKIDTITKDIESLQEKYDNKLKESDVVMKDLSFTNDVIAEINKKKDNIQRVIELLEDKDELDKRMESLKTEYLSIRDNIESIKEKADAIIIVDKNIKDTDEIISKLDDEIAELKFKLTNLLVYKKDVENLKTQYEKTTFVRNLCSQTGGNSIQAEYVKMYMNDIITTCNSLLKYMFNGELVLQLPVIEDKEFSIPFIGPFGMVVPDISKGSTAQKCMIGLAFNCASMMRMSSKYNLFRLDEIDGGLDTSNRYGFITALNYLLDITNAEQCIMISHNMEFDTQSVSKIVCTKRNGLQFT